MWLISWLCYYIVLVCYWIWHTIAVVEHMLLYLNQTLCPENPHGRGLIVLVVDAWLVCCYIVAVHLLLFLIDWWSHQYHAAKTMLHFWNPMSICPEIHVYMRAVVWLQWEHCQYLAVVCFVWLNDDAWWWNALLQFVLNLATVQKFMWFSVCCVWMWLLDCCMIVILHVAVYLVMF